MPHPKQHWRCRNCGALLTTQVCLECKLQKRPSTNTVPAKPRLLKCKPEYSHYSMRVVSLADVRAAIREYRIAS